MSEEKRALTEDEITDLCSVIEPLHSLRFYTDTVVVQNIRESTKKQLCNVKIYPSLLPKLKQIIRSHYVKACVAPGEMVGCTAASSIGEQFTQSSLNSFHSSGSSKAHLTTGLGRVNELLNATKNLKTPSLTIYFNEDIKDLRVVRRLCQKYIIWQTIRTLIRDYTIEHRPDVSADKFYHYSTELISDGWTQCSWRIRLMFDVYKLWVCGKTLMDVCKAITACIDTSVLNFVISHDAQGIIDIWVSDVCVPINQLVNFKNTEPNKLQILETWLQTGQGSMYYYTTNVVLPVLLTVPVSGVCGVQDCYYTEDDSRPGTWYVDTKGGSLKSLYSLNCIDHLRCRTNSMWETCSMFGIEAAKVFLKEEFTKLISASKRHLELLISTMTVSGKITAVSRYGIDRNEVGAISKAAFEQPVENFLISATRGECDKINSVSASVTVAKLARIGTNMFDVETTDQSRNHDFLDSCVTELDTIQEDSGDMEF